jgi:hypothetical protein
MSGLAFSEASRAQYYIVCPRSKCQRFLQYFVPHVLPKNVPVFSTYCCTRVDNRRKRPGEQA